MSDLLLLETGGTDNLLLETGDALLLESGSITSGTIVEIGFGSTWQTEPAAIAWERVTDYVLNAPGLVMRRGASSARGRVDVGSLSLSLLNNDRRFDPTYTAGPFYGLLKPGVPIRVKHRPLGQSEFSVWYGSVSSWPQRYDMGNRFSWVPLECYDGFDKLARAKIPRSPLEAEILADDPLGYWPLDETDGDVMVDRSGNGYDGTYVAGTTDLSVEVSTSGLAKIRGVNFDGEHRGVVTDAEAVVLDRPAVVELVFNPGVGILPLVDMSDGKRNSGFTATVVSTSTTWEVSMTLFDGDGQNTVTNTTAATHRDSPWHVAYRRQGAGDALLYVDGVAAGTATTLDAISAVLAPGVAIGARKKQDLGAAFEGFLAHVAVYASDLTATRILAHANAALAPLDDQTTDDRIDWILDQIDWPTNQRNLEVGKTTLGPATFKAGDRALDYLRLVEATEDGRLFTAGDGRLRFLDRYWRYLNTSATTSNFTFSDAVANRGYAEFELSVDDELLVNVARLTRRGGTEQVVTNASSVATHGEAETSQTDLLLRTDNEVRSLGQWTVATQGTPLPRVPKIRVPLHRYSAADQATILGLELGYRVTVTRTPQAVGSAITTAFLIDGIGHEVTETEWWWEAYVSPVPSATASVFVLGTSTLGGTHVLGY